MIHPHTHAFRQCIQAIRRKIEQDLSKKRHSSRKAKQTQKVTAGTVSALRVSQALTVSESITVTEASQNMAAKRADCVLVINDEEHLSGIFTAKDLAFRVVAAYVYSKACCSMDPSFLRWQTMELILLTLFYLNS